MKACELTGTAAAARTWPMTGRVESAARRAFRHGLAVAVLAGAVGLAGCIQVAAPDKPIVIELNINIRQEVVYRLAADAAKTVEQNEGIF